jgi:hypothetical protein
MSTRTKVMLTKLIVFSPNNLVDDRLCVLIPMLCPAAVTHPEGDFGTTKDIVPLAETDPFFASGDVATLAKIAALIVKPRRAASHECFAPMCELLHTVSANQTCNSTIPLLGQAPLALNAQRPPITGVPGAQIGSPLWGGTRLCSQGRVVPRPASIQADHADRAARSLSQAIARATL